MVWANTSWVQTRFASGVVGGSAEVLVEQTFWRSCCRCPFEVAIDLGRCFVNYLGSQTCPSTDVNGVYCLGPSGYKRYKSTVMEILD